MERLDKVLEDLNLYINTKKQGNYYGNNKVQVIDLLRTSGDLDGF